MSASGEGTDQPVPDGETPPDKRTQANRHNAAKSTGPKSPEGKAASKMNALKHGLLAESVVVNGHKFNESPHEFKKLCREFHQYYEPDGPVEAMLVDQIATATWRLRRVLTAESGEIALSADAVSWKREQHFPLPVTLSLPKNPFGPGLLWELHCSAGGCRYLVIALEAVRRDVERDGALTAESLSDFNTALRDQGGQYTTKLEELHAELTANPNNLDPDTLKARHKAQVLAYLDDEIRSRNLFLDERRQREDAEEEAQARAAVLPSEATLDKLLRYQTALERQLYRAMNQLERLQRRRQGENVPAPLAVLT